MLKNTGMDRDYLAAVKMQRAHLDRIADALEKIEQHLEFFVTRTEVEIPIPVEVTNQVAVNRR
jgi:hypothetical protein